jgi:K+-transporting ATPase ATPase C chain
MDLAIRNALRPALVLLLFLAALTGLAYPALVTALAEVALPAQAQGSLVADHGRVIGSELIAQGFAAPRYIHPRPSAAGKGYDAANSSPTNLAPGSKDLRDAIAVRVGDARAHEGLRGAVPADLVTSSASGLDPDLSPEAALAQAARVAHARGLSEARVRAAITAAVEWPLFGIIGEPHVNVFKLNRQLDRISSNPAR